ncbi:hypothetical protein CC78DRAFT_537752 [Lojkania enalia]|uniref:Tat pathway signal sequence n=1 Tax=Lojkania enalia TaxID=147567 RepID=A0A9P4K2T4_9PLEO|nr:hypothetical protein CC78DRAFT_537752 [Didymosphaeria enalia]
MAFWDRKRKQHQQIVEPQPKRISTPAGQRLSVILENGGDPQAKATRDGHRTSLRKSGISIGALGEAPRESVEESNGSSGYSYSVWSDGEKFGAIRNHKQIAKRGGWKRLAIIIAIVIACIIALAVGLALGLKKKKSSDSSDAQATAGGTASPNNNDTPNPTATISISPTSAPSNFPIGTYSLITFLDTVQTNCTSNPLTWTCYPYTIYNDSPEKALATFNWIISSPSSGKYQISSTDNPFSISFKNQELELLDAGKDTERYHFQLSQTKTVRPSKSLAEDNAAAECEFKDTSLQAFLYTKMAKGYPDKSKGEPSGNPSYQEWPFAVRVEQAVAGAQNIPSCYKLNNGVPGESITENITPQDPSQLCSCLYKNWRTPSPY